jgi:acyl-CoA thioester hydrolase
LNLLSESLPVRFEESVTSVRVRPNDLDSLGHVNNATVLEYFEAGRWAWMDQHGLRHGTRVLAVVARIEVDYRREILPQELEVRTVLEPPEGEDLEDEDAQHYRVYFRQKVLIDSGRQVAAEARLQVAFIDASTRALSTLQEFLAAARSPR